MSGEAIEVTVSGWVNLRLPTNDGNTIGVKVDVVKLFNQLVAAQEQAIKDKADQLERQAAVLEAAGFRGVSHLAVMNTVVSLGEWIREQKKSGPLIDSAETPHTTGSPSDSPPATNWPPDT